MSHLFTRPVLALTAAVGIAGIALIGAELTLASPARAPARTCAVASPAAPASPAPVLSAHRHSRARKASLAGRAHAGAGQARVLASLTP